MSCSLKEVKDGLVNLKIVSSYMEIKSMDKVLRFENSYIDAYTKKHGSLVELGSMFVFEDLRGKTKLAFNKPFFEKMDQLENAVFFKKNALREGFSEEEVVSDLEIKEGVDSIFEANPQLEEIGSQEEYSAYLDAAFPDRKVKEIVAHVSREKGIEKFRPNESETGNFINSQVLGSGVYFAPVDMVDYWSMELQFIDDVTGEYTEDRNIYYAVLDSRSPQYAQKNYLEDSDAIEGADVIVNESRVTGIIEEYVVKDPSIIHILGSEQDINGFNDYIESISSEESIASQEQDAIMQEVYAKIDSMLESNEITVTCKI
jgi:hypothetical protein